VLGECPLHVIAMYVESIAMSVGKTRPNGDKKDRG